MRALMIVCQMAAALGLLNVWLLRRNRSTAFRGGNAKTMQEEFATYGLPSTMVAVVGTLKIAIAIALIVGVWIPSLVLPAAALLCVLMFGALAMHARVRDPLMKSMPAVGMLVLAGILVAGALRA